MAGTKVQIKRSSVAGRTPTTSDIDVGELAVNLTDKRLFTKDGSNTIIEVLGQSLNTTANVTFRDGAFANISATTLAGNLEWSYVTSKPDLKIDITGDATGNNTFTDLANGSIQLTLANTTVAAGTYGNSSAIPVITVDSKGRITAATTNAVAGITGYSYTSANNTFAIAAGDGSVYRATINTVNTLSVSNTLTVTGVGTFSNDVNITGNLTVLGVTSFVNTTQLDIGDNIITLNANVTGTPVLNAGIEIERGTSLNTSLLWNEADDAWTFTNDGTTYQKIVGNNQFDQTVLSIVTAYEQAASNAYANAVATAATDATNKAANAYSNAVSFATSAAANAYSNAVSFATSAAANAYSNATSYADTAAATAYTNAVSTAATDASSKAATAYANAIAYANTVAAAAFTNAAAYAASNSYVNSTFAKLSGATFTGPVDGITTLAAGNTTVSGYVNTNIGFFVYGTSNRVLTANAGGIWPSSNSAGLNLGDPDKRWWYFAANTGSFSGTLDVTGATTLGSVNVAGMSSFANVVLFSSFEGLGTRIVSSQHIGVDADLVMAPGELASNGFVVRGFRGGNTNTNLKILNSGVATFANTIIAPTIFVGNSTVNATVNSTAFALNGVAIGGSGPAEAAYSNAVAYADTVATTAYNNAVTYADNKAANAYANAIAYSGNAAAAYANAVAYTDTHAATNTYVNTQLALKANLGGPTFTGLVTVSGAAAFAGNVEFGNTRITANGSVGTAGQVLTTGGPSGNVYWANVAAGGANLTLTSSGPGIHYFPMSGSASGTWSNGEVDSNLFYNTSSTTLTLNNGAFTITQPGIGNTTIIGNRILLDVGAANWANLTSTQAAYYSTNSTATVNASGIYIGNNTFYATINSTSFALNGVPISGGGGGGGGNGYGTIAVSGQSSLIAEQTNAALTFVAGNNMTITTNATSGEITFTSNGSGGTTLGTGPGNAFISARDNFTGNGSNTAFTLSQSATANSILVLVEGLVQFHDEDYDVSGTTLTFVGAPANNEAIEVLHIAGATTYHFMQYGAIDTFTGNGSNTVYTLSRTANTSTATVYLDGLIQAPTTDFTFSGNTLTFTAAPLSGESVLVYHNDSVATAIPGTAIASTDTFAGDGSTTSFALSGSANSSTSVVTINGLVQGYTTEYSVSGTTLTFNEAPPSGSIVQAMRLVGSVGAAYSSITVGSSTIVANTPSTALTLANTAGVTLSASNNTVNIGLTDIAKQSLTGDGIANTFTLTYSATSDNIFVYVNGVYFHPDEDYTVTGTTLSFFDPPIDTSQIRIRFMRAPSGLISLMGDLTTGTGSYDMSTQDGPPVDLNA